MGLGFAQQVKLAELRGGDGRGGRRIGRRGLFCEREPEAGWNGVPLPPEHARSVREVGGDVFFRLAGDPGLGAHAELFTILFQLVDLSAKDLLFSGLELPVAEAGRAKNSGHGVVVACRDLIEFVIVAASAGDGHSQQRAGDRVDLFVDDVGFFFRAILLGRDLDPHGQVGGRRQPAIGDGRIRRVRQEVAGELFADELVEGAVLVEGVYDVVAVVVGEGIGRVLIGAVRVGVAYDVEPVTSPALSVVGRTKQPVDQVFPGSRVLVVDEVVDLRGSRGEADQVVGESPNECPAIGLAWRAHLLVCQPAEHVAVNPVANQRLHPGVFRRVIGQRPEGPEAGLGFPVDHLFLGGSGDRVSKGVRCRGAQPDPALKIFRHALRQLPSRGHLELVVPQRRQRQALPGLAGSDGGSGFASFEPALAAVESQLALELL